jgi:hypothetical protein
MNAHPNGITGQSMSLPSYHTASQSVHAAIIDDFGDHTPLDSDQDLEPGGVEVREV